jgi:hypothetical protein
MRITAEELATEISRFVNGANVNEVEKLADLMTNDHPTLQQSKMRLFCMFIENMANKSYTDARNDESKKVANAMIRGFKDHSKQEIIKQDGYISKSLETYIEEKVVPSKNLPLI